MSKRRQTTYLAAVGLLSVLATVGLACVFASVGGCRALARRYPVLFGRGYGAQWRMEYEGHKSALLSAQNEAEEAAALTALGAWLSAHRYFGYEVSTVEADGSSRLDLSALQPGDALRLRLYARSDYEPRDRFTLNIRNPDNLPLLWEADDRGSR